MPAFNYDTIGDVLNYDYRQGKILTLDADKDECSVSISDDGTVDCLILYH